MHFVVERSSRLGSKELHLTHPKGWQDGDGEEDNTDTPNPLGETAPKEDAMRHHVEIVDNSGTCAGET